MAAGVCWVEGTRSSAETGTLEICGASAGLDSAEERFLLLVCTVCFFFFTAFLAVLPSLRIDRRRDRRRCRCRRPSASPCPWPCCSMLMLSFAPWLSGLTSQRRRRKRITVGSRFARTCIAALDHLPQLDNVLDDCLLYGLRAVLLTCKEPLDGLLPHTRVRRTHRRLQPNEWKRGSS